MMHWRYHGETEWRDPPVPGDGRPKVMCLVHHMGPEHWSEVEPDQRGKSYGDHKRVS